MAEKNTMGSIVTGLIDNPLTTNAMNRTNFGELLTPVHKKVFFDSYKEIPKIYDKTFKVESMNAAVQSYPHMGAFGLWESNKEGNEFNRDEINEGPTATFVAKRYDKGYEVTWELCQDDQYNVFKGNGKGAGARNLSRGLAATEETQAAEIIRGGFSEEKPGYDGVSLFNDAHPLKDGGDKTVSNIVTGGLTDEKLKEALTLMRTQTDEAGVFIAAHAKQLVVHPDWEFTARAIVNSTLQAGTNNNDTNTVPSLNIIVWDYLAEGEIKPWYVQDTSIDNLMLLWREKPIFDSEKVDNKMDYRFYGYCRFDCGYVDWRGLVGSKGI